MKLSFSRIKYLLAIYAATFFLSLHTYLVLYINSSFVGKYASESMVGFLYAFASIFTLIVYFNASKILNFIGNFWFTLILIATSALAIGGMLLFKQSLFILISFVLYQFVISLIFFNLDIFLEYYTKNENSTGSVRAIFLTLANTALVLSPSIVAFVLTNGDYWKVYLLSLICFVPLLLIVTLFLHNFKDPYQKDLTVIGSVRNILNRVDIYRISVSRFILEIFFSVMVVYVPIYLNTIIGFSWSEIGFMFTIMLLPFMLFELLVGRLADKWIGEKEILITGFVITSVATFMLSIFTYKYFWLWAVLLFLTRTGASFIEITTESYFFKHVKSKDAQEIGLFRSTRPLSYIVGPIFAGIVLYFTSYKVLFVLLSLVTLSALYFVSKIRDTR